MNFSYENNGPYSYLVYRFEDDVDIDRTTLGMITNNTIPAFAPAFFMQADSGKYIKYNISSRITARNFFSGGVTKKRLLGVLNCIADAVLSAEDYMIDTDTLLLDLDYIFVGVRTSDAVLICLPDVKRESAANLVDFFKMIIFSVQYPQNENNDYVTRLMNELNKPSVFRLEDFKELIASLLEPAEAQTRAEQPTPPVEQGIPQSAPEARAVAVPAAQTVQPVVSPAVRIAVPPVAEPASVPLVPPEAEKKPEKRSLFHRKDKPKKEKKDKKKERKESTVAPAGTVGFSVPGHEGEKQSATANAPEHAPVPLTPAQPMVSVSPAQASPVTPVVPVAPAVPVMAPVSVPAPMPASVSVSPYPVLDEETGFMPDSTDETMIMGQEGSARSLAPHLIRRKNNERIPLNREVFRLGRNVDFNDYAIVDNRFVGHSHCHIVSRNGEYFIVDDNSKNHTKVNGTQITPGTEVKLAHEYVISVADEEFEFRLF